jgi:hypothetical protein
MPGCGDCSRGNSLLAVPRLGCERDALDLGAHAMLTLFDLAIVVIVIAAMPFVIQAGR